MESEIYSRPNQIMIIGKRPLPLRGKYCQKQYWLDFMRGFTFEIPTHEYKTQNGRYSYSYECRKTNKYAYIEDDCKTLELYSEDRQQPLLPFAEIQRVTESRLDRLRSFDYPGWQRDEEGNILTLKVNTKKYPVSKVTAMLYRMCRGRFYFWSTTILLELADDYCMMKLALK